MLYMYEDPKKINSVSINAQELRVCVCVCKLVLLVCLVLGKLDK